MWQFIIENRRCHFQRIEDRSVFKNVSVPGIEHPRIEMTQVFFKNSPGGICNGTYFDQKVFKMFGTYELDNENIL